VPSKNTLKKPLAAKNIARLQLTASNKELLIFKLKSFAMNMIKHI